MSRSKRTLAVVCLTLLTIVACKDKTKPFKYDLVTRSEAKAFAKKLEKALTTCTRASMATVYDVDGMMRLVAQGVAKNKRKQLIAGQSQVRLADSCRTATKAGKAKYLRITAGAEPRVLIRMIFPDGSFNYVEYFVGKRDGRVVAYDMRSYSMGRRQTEIAREVFKSLLSDSAGVRGIGLVTEFMRLGKFKKAHVALSMLPAEVRKSEGVMLWAVSIAAELDDAKEFTDALEAFVARFPNNPAADFHGIDRLIVLKRFKAALDSIDRIDKRVRGDAYLDVIRASVYSIKGDLAAMASHIRKALMREPGVVTKYWEDQLAEYDKQRAARAKPASPSAAPPKRSD